ncbi:PD-(D/E)XK nuclease domain-containing protein [Candidatus Dependentiae bacterium]|nr:PD-(D/E)XK nuclease domain-containing protein [Candidatus Dependentiae bacterium]
MEQLCSLLGNLFAHIPYQIDKRQEAHYHSMMHLFILSLGFDSQAEISTNKGRIDLVEGQKSSFIFLR